MSSFWMVFEFWARKIRNFSKKFSAKLSLIHSMHPDFFSEMKYIFLFWSNLSFWNFFSSFEWEFWKSWRKVFKRITNAAFHLSRGKIKRKKVSWKLFLGVFFWILSLEDFGLLAKNFSRDVRNAFHVSRVPFREKIFFCEINLLIDKFTNCAEGLWLLARTSQHGCQNYSLAVQTNTLAYFFFE